ncbi:unnamed protein product [Polarella glacialis]|uniref:SH3 domain-containing protein n=1 Tax=Polarella glacialis TaxID=89957 RepID=A0A813LRC4_POLGL|nr:unnamed protein product [Polarella glacialis]
MCTQDGAYAGRASVRMPLCDRVALASYLPLNPLASAVNPDSDVKSSLPLPTEHEHKVPPSLVLRTGSATETERNGRWRRCRCEGPSVGPSLRYRLLVRATKVEVPLRFTAERLPWRGKIKMEWLCREADLDHAEWIKIGCVREGEEARELTEWSVPAWPGSQIVTPSSVRSGRVKVRTAAGSDGVGCGGGLRLRGSTRGNFTAERAGQMMTVERRFSSSPAEFSEKMEQHLGKAIMDPDGALVWKQPGGDARIVMYSEDQCVKVIGRPNQVRQLAVILAPYTEAMEQAGGHHLAPSYSERLPEQDHQRSTSRSRPSEVFAPNVAPLSEPTPTGEGPPAVVQDPGAAPEAKGEEGHLHVATQAFEPQGQGELALQQGSSVQVVLDPEAGVKSQDRWVYGRLEDSGLCGWFPLSHSVRAQV